MSETETLPPMSDEDKKVLALVQLQQGPIILQWDWEIGAFLIVDYIEEEPGGERPVPRLEYQLSNGVPGDRTTSEDYYTYAEAIGAWDEFCQNLRGRRMRRGVL